MTETAVNAFLELFRWMVDPSVDPLRTRINEFLNDYMDNDQGEE